MIHTEIPTMRKSLPLDLGYMFHYVSAMKQLPKADGFRFSDTSAFGAIVNLIVGGEIIQLSKKKVRWCEIASYFYGARLDEIKKHGQINLVGDV